VRRDASPVVPRMQSPSVWFSLWNWRIVRRDGMSTSPLGRKGVTSATVDPCLSGTCGYMYIFVYI
jgi:hypothetical protein